MNMDHAWQVLDWIAADGFSRLGVALGHFLWQGCVVALLYAVAARLLRGTSANTRYLTGVAALLLMAACLPVTLVVIPPSETVQEHGSDNPGPVAIVEEPPAPIREIATAPPLPESTVPAPMRPLPSLPPTESAKAVPVTPVPVVPAATPPARVSSPDMLARLLPWASILYLCGVFTMLIRVALGLWGGRRLRRDCTPVAETAILDLLGEHARRMGMRAAPMIAACGRVSVPLVVGIFRPMILIPTGLISGLTPGELEAVLVHELAHIRRFDPVVNVLQRLVEAVLFFHPAVWWVSRSVSVERENACDDLVLRTNCGRNEYASALVHMAELCVAGGSPAMIRSSALAATGKNGVQFRRRVLRVLKHEERIPVRLTAPAIAVSMLLILTLMLAPAAWRGMAWAKPEAEIALDDRIEANLEILREYQVGENESTWAAAVRDLIEIGKPAVPKLIEELDRTERDATLRAMGFVLRGIDDPRAAPALIRAIPRTLPSNGIDYGFRIDDDPELSAFMVKHDNTPDESARPGMFSYARPIHEIMPALEKLADHKIPRSDLRFVSLEGSREQRRVKRGLFLKLARQWADWWSEHWPDLVANENEAQLEQIEQSLRADAEATARIPKQQPSTEFPCGPNVVVSAGMAMDYRRIRSFKEQPERAFFDLDTGRRPRPSESLIETSAEDAPSKELLGWAEKEGVDLITVKAKNPAGDGWHYAFWPVGMRVWQIDDDRCRKIGEELRRAEKPELPEPWQRPLAVIDESKPIPAYLFITKQGTCGRFWPLYREYFPGSTTLRDEESRYNFIYADEAEEAVETTPDPLNSSEDHKPVSMSAEEFARLSAEEQKALLVRVFQRRLEHSRNLYYELDQTFRGIENPDGKAGKPPKRLFANRCQYRHWRVDDSYRMDTKSYLNLEAAEPSSFSSMGVNAAEGLGRNISIPKDGKRPPSGDVQYPLDPSQGNLYLTWLTPKYSQDYPVPRDYLFPDLLEHKDDFKIEAPVAGDKVRLTVPWQPQWNGKRVFILDPEKGFLPVRCDSSYDCELEDGRPMWRKERFTVEDSRLVGDVWMPVWLKTELRCSSGPDMMNTNEAKVTRIEHGTATSADIRVPFTEGMVIHDVVEGAIYTADAQGRPGPDLKLAPNWKHRPPKGWKRGDPGGTFSMASRYSPADRKKLGIAQGKIDDRRVRLEETLNVLQADSTVPLDDRIGAGLGILREYKVGENQPIWAGAIRELTEIGKPAVPKLIEELDRTEHANTLRALAFILRGIDDPRAAPALIRAIPRTFQAGGGDYGLRIDDDPDLAKFMGSHDTGKGSGTGGFTYGAPRREIMPALEKLTHHAIPHNDLRFAYFRGGAKQRRLQQEIFLKFARQWADWWSKHWRDVVENEDEAQLDLIEKSLGRYAEGIARAPKPSATTEFPRGPNVTVSDWTLYSLIRSFKERPEGAFFDLDSGRKPRPSKAIIDASAEDEPSKELLDWAEKEGVDLITVKVKNPDGEGANYAFWPVGMKVWRIDNDRYDNIEKELRRDEPFELPKPGQGPLALIDEETGKYEKKSTASYLFITKEGTCGRLQLKGPLYQEYGVGASGSGGLRYDFVYKGGGESEQEESEAEKTTPAPIIDSSEELKPVSMSAEEFARLSAEEQKALLVRVFERRLEHAENLHYEAELFQKVYENRDGKPGKPLDYPDAYPLGLRRVCRWWRMGDSFRREMETYNRPTNTEPDSRDSCGVDVEEGLGRNTYSSKQGKTSQGQVQYPHKLIAYHGYDYWVNAMPDDCENPVSHGRYVFSDLLKFQDDYEIEVPAEGGFVRLSVPWELAHEKTPSGKRVYLLDPRKGFLPVRCDARHEGHAANGHSYWGEETFVVEESRLVDDVWMPLKLTETTVWSHSPHQITVDKTTVSRIEHGSVTRADLHVPFSEGMRIQDTVEGATYTVNAQGRPGPDLKLDPGWKQKPPKDWKRGEPFGDSSMASNFTPADREKLAAAQGKVDDKRVRMEKNLKVLQSDSTVALEDRVEAGLKILREYEVFENEPIWAAAVRELIEIGKPAVPKLIEELDRTERNASLRALGFVLRGIDDPRAVPALIRAIPRTLQPASSDCGLLIRDDLELAKFMAKHDNEAGEGSGNGRFSYGVPMREVMPALEKLAGHEIPRNDIRFVSLEGGPKQRRAKRAMFLKLARRWADWWSEHWRDVVENEDEAQLDLIEQSLGRYAAAIARESKKATPAEFPRGPNVVVSDGTLDSLIRSFKERPEEAFFDLDSGRHPQPSKAIIEASAEDKPSKELLDWAEKEGVDLITVKIKTPTATGRTTPFGRLG